MSGSVQLTDELVEFPMYVLLDEVASEHRAREPAAAPHAAVYGDLQPPARAMRPAF